MNTQTNPSASDRSPESHDQLETIIEAAIADGTFGSSLDSLHEAQLDELVSLLEKQQEEAGASTGKQIPSKVQRTVHKAVKVVSLGFVDPGKKKQAQVKDSFTHWDRIRDLLREARATKHKKWEHESDQNSKQTNRIRSLLERQYKGLENSERIHIGDEMKGPDNDWGIITLDRNAKDLDILSFVEQNLPEAQKIWEGLKKKSEELGADTQSINAGFSLYVSQTPPYHHEISATEVFAYAEDLKKALIQADFLPKMESIDTSSKRYDVPTIHISTSNSFDTETPEGHTDQATIFVDMRKSVAENVAYIRSCFSQLQKHEEKVLAQHDVHWKLKYEAESKERNARIQLVLTTIQNIFPDNTYPSRVELGDEMKGPDAEWGIITVDSNAPESDIRKFLEGVKTETLRLWAELDTKKQEISSDGECRSERFKLTIDANPGFNQSISRDKVYERARELKAALIEAKSMPDIHNSYDFPTIVLGTNNSFDDGNREGFTAPAWIVVDATQSLVENIAYIQSCQPGLNDYAKAIANERAQRKARPE